MDFRIRCAPRAVELSDPPQRITQVVAITGDNKNGVGFIQYLKLPASGNAVAGLQILQTKADAFFKKAMPAFCRDISLTSNDVTISASEARSRALPRTRMTSSRADARRLLPSATKPSSKVIIRSAATFRNGTAVRPYPATPMPPGR